MKRIEFDTYDLLLSNDPCSIFEHFEMINMHGLNYYDCIFDENTEDSSYIAGLCNMIPNSDRQFIFINLSRCTDDISTILLIFHELLHHSFYLNNHDMNKEEEIISWAEKESYVIYQHVKYELQNNNITEENT